MNTIGSRIREVRKKMNLTQDEFGLKIGIGRGMVFNIEKDLLKTGIPTTTIKAIASTFNVREEWITNGTGEMMIGEAPAVIADLMKEYYEKGDEGVYLNLLKALKQLQDHQIEAIKVTIDAFIKDNENKKAEHYAQLHVYN